MNGKIRAREVRVIAHDGQQVGVLTLADALNLARQQGLDLVEISPNAVPPVCRVVDYGKYRYELAKREKDSKKSNHSSKVKEIQLSPSIDPHDFGVKRDHAINFLCEDMKVKISLRFRGREMAHKEYGFQQVQKIIVELAPFGHPDQPPKLVGRGITAMLSPLPRNKRAKNPNAPDLEPGETPAPSKLGSTPKMSSSGKPIPESGFANNPFSELDAAPPAPPSAPAPPSSEGEPPESSSAMS
ncbi:MAG: translation initiation factor IF-3 [Verrucomicrobia bacterium]|nr:translation initiation factor IF-3 [Verrucomicrobiota bacterium]MBI3869616.1 translation initiation factor IF-3 [Verrucomicrobiota bacterium]